MSTVEYVFEAFHTVKKSAMIKLVGPTKNHALRYYIEILRGTLRLAVHSESEKLKIWYELVKRVAKYVLNVVIGDNYIVIGVYMRKIERMRHGSRQEKEE